MLRIHSLNSNYYSLFVCRCCQQYYVFSKNPKKKETNLLNTLLPLRIIYAKILKICFSVLNYASTVRLLPEPRLCCLSVSLSKQFAYGRAIKTKVVLLIFREFRGTGKWKSTKRNETKTAEILM